MQRGRQVNIPETLFERTTPPSPYIAIGMVMVLGGVLLLRPAMQHLVLEQLGRTRPERFCIPDGPMTLVYLR